MRLWLHPIISLQQAEQRYNLNLRYVCSLKSSCLFYFAGVGWVFPYSKHIVYTSEIFFPEICFFGWFENYVYFRFIYGHLKC